MKIMLNGATAGTNFGDYLFAEVFQNYIGEKIGRNNVYWYKSRYAYSDFFEKKLNNNNKCKFQELNGLVYISGGYFCGEDYTIKDYIFRFLRYFLIGYRFIITKKPYAIIGLEVGKSKSKVMNFVQKTILKHSRTLVVRNQESFDAVKQIGINNVICTADTVFAFNDNFLKKYQIPGNIANYNGKILLLHINPRIEQNGIIKRKIVPIVNTFLERHSEYAVLLATDQYSVHQKEAEEDIASILKTDNILYYMYDKPFELCKVISLSDVIVTTKLHVGIVGAKLGRSVISFSGHSEKIKRLYSQLNEEERTISLKDLTYEEGVAIIEKYYNKPIQVDINVIRMAKQNFKFLDEFLDSLSYNA